MAKSTIILADIDENFLTPLELKFLEELDDKIELEIITEPAYFREYFSSPKGVDVLVVSEELYSSELQKHNINNIFVLTESIDEGGTEDLGVKKIFKYTSTQEIYKEVSLLSSIDNNRVIEKETIIVLVYSASGGAGKSTIALGISASLAKSFNKVLYINAQRLNSFQHNLANTAAIPNSSVFEFADTSGNMFGRINHIIRNEGFDYLPPFSMALPSIGLDFSVYAELAKSAKLSKKYDVIVMDTDCVFDKEKADLITLADKVIMVMQQTKNSVFATDMLLKNISCNDNEKYHFVCNDFKETESNALASSNYVINEYIKHFDNFDSMTINDIGKQQDIQKVSYLIDR